MGLLLLTWTTCGLVLQSWFFIEKQFNGIAFAKLEKIVNPTKNTFLTNPNIFIYTMLFFLLNICECLQYHQHQ